MSDDDHGVPNRTRVGRPPLSAVEPSYQVSTRLPEHIHDRLLALASRSGQPVSEVLRAIVILRLK